MTLRRTDSCSQPRSFYANKIEAAVASTRHLCEPSTRHLCKLRSHGRKPALVVSLGPEGSARHRAGTLWQISAVSWRAMDASVLGVEKGVTPFADQPALIPLPMPFDSIPTATLSTGAAVLAQPSDDAAIDADLVDMETLAVVRAAHRFSLPTVGLRAVSDSPRAAGGKEASGGMESWTDRLAHIDALLARAIDQTPTILERVPRPTSG